MNSFERSLSGKVNVNFYICGQLCSFIRRLASRCLVSASVPEETDWLGLLNLNPGTATKLSPQQFLHKLRIESKVAVACKRKAESDLSDAKGSGSKDAVANLAAKLQEQFATAGCGYVCYLLDTVLKHVSLTSELVRGLASFDPTIVFCSKLDLARSLFQVLVRSFTSRGWARAKDNDRYMDEYIGFVEDARKGCSGLVENPNLVFDAASFYVSMPALRSRTHLLHLYRLSCLCLTSSIPDFPAIVFGSIDSSRLGNIMGEVSFPVQSYLSVVDDSVSVCTSDSALLRFSSVEDQFGDDGLPETYDPWTSVDHFGRWDLFQKFQGVFTSSSGGQRSPVVKRGSKSSSVASATKANLSGVVSGPSSELISCAVEAVSADLRECGSKE